jgi:pyruvate dehydrogenase E2 component (dihydrolipoamide acetyltransferase)
MSQIIEAKVPDIGDYHDVPVIDVCVQAGDTVRIDDALITLESDKATMDVPSSVAGVVKEVKVKLGDKLSEGAVVALIESGGTAEATATPVAAAARRRQAPPRRRRPRRRSPAVPTSNARCWFSAPDRGATRRLSAAPTWGCRRCSSSVTRRSVASA